MTTAKFLSDAPPPMRIDVKRSYTALMNTSCGSMKIRLLPRTAPQAVNNFVTLARQHWYNGMTFHRVASSIDVIQGGDPKCSAPDIPGCGSGGPGYSFPDELTGREQYSVGTVAMANSGPDTNGSQFFIVTGEGASQLPPSYTIFGRLMGSASLSTARKIQGVPLQPGSERPVAPVWIRGVKIRES